MPLVLTSIPSDATTLAEAGYSSSNPEVYSLADGVISYTGDDTVLNTIISTPSYSLTPSAGQKPVQSQDFKMSDVAAGGEREKFFINLGGLEIIYKTRTAADRGNKYIGIAPVGQSPANQYRSYYTANLTWYTLRTEISETGAVEVFFSGSATPNVAVLTYQTDAGLTY